jgi:hypothetical protein
MSAEVKVALEALGVTVVEHSFDEEARQVNVLCRVRDVTSWLVVVDTILAEEERAGSDAPWNVHICKHYMRRNGKLCYGWNVTVQLTSDSALNDFCRLLSILGRQFSPPPVTRPSKKTSKKDPPPKAKGGVMEDGQVVEMPLVGVTEQRNAPQADILTPGVRGQGRRSGVSSKGARPLMGGH